ncbi:MAG: alpha/beta hydrolase [Caulobacteraceae bacterium]|nr:alpha/beta hydrolase [Caulobacteraceae bacterium]
MRLLFISQAMAVVLMLAGCAKPAELAAPPGVTITPLRSLSKWEGALLLRLSGVSGIELKHDVDCYRVLYPTLDMHGRPTRASGLLALPRGRTPTQLVSFQHGTTTSPDRVPSRLDGTGKAVALAFAGTGYALVAPDYLGLGSSEGVHPYLVAEDAGRTVADLISAVQPLAGVPEGPVFLSGFSQGGQATTAALRIIEASGETALGAAPVAGPYDLRRVSLPAAMQGGAASHSLYLAYMSRGYAAKYRRPLDGLLTPAWAAKVETLFGQPHSGDAIIKALPADPRALFGAEFLDAFDNDRPHWLLTALAQRDQTNWTPRTPVRMYFGSADPDVVPEEAVRAARTMQARGADVRAIDVGAVGHDASMLAAAPKILAWLRALEAEASAPAAAPRAPPPPSPPAPAP